jgi:hypothetical protein
MTDYTISGAGGGAWTDQLANNPTFGRYHDLGIFTEGAAGSGNVFKQARPGILPGPPVAGSSNIPGAFAIAPTSGLGFNIQPGAAILERNTLSGLYHVQSTAVGTGAVGTADPSQTRIDLVTLDHFDGALGDNSSTTLTRVHVKPGTPGGGVPAIDVTAGARQILGWWTIPALTSTLTTGMWTPARKSAGLRGGVRLLLEGDSLADPGFDSGELRDTTLLQTPGWIDRWDSANSLWRHCCPANGTGTAFVGGQLRSTGIATNGVNEVAFVSVGALVLDANSMYRITFQSVGTPAVTTVERWAQRIRKTSVTGTQLTASVTAPASNGTEPMPAMVQYMYRTTAVETTTFVGTMQRVTSNGTAQWSVSGPDTFITVEYAGPSSFFSSV